MARSSKQNVLDELRPEEHHAVLDALLDAHPDLRHEAERAAASLMTDIDSGTVAAAVIETYLSQSYMDIADRAGRRPDRGYVHEADAQWELLEEALEPNLEEIARLTRLGFERAAEEHAYAVIAGLDQLRRTADEETLVGWGALEDHVDELAEAVRHACRTCGVVLAVDPSPAR